MKKIFIDELIKATRKNRNICLIVNDLGFGMIEPFQKEFPQNVFNSGVSEQSMMGYAAGLSSVGKHVFVYSIANFNTFRCAEQIRNDIDYHKLKVTIVSAGSGVGYGSLGYSHHAIQDYALIRSFPNMLISSPGDDMELKSCMDYLIKNPQPSYLRLDKSLEFKIHKTKPKVFPGKWIQIGENNLKKYNKEIYLTTGPVVKFLQKKIKEKKLKSYPIFTLPLWGMKHKKNQYKYLKKFSRINIIEDHLIDGGFFSWLNECMSNKKLISKSLSKKVISKVGSHNYLMNFLK
tara:strand:- start:445 stop:1314 length:870 start_codon:yes stop_codon:yes gene_type:complete